MRITPELRTKITEHFYYYRDDTQNESIIDESPKDINETSYYEKPYARDDLRTRIRDEIFYIDQYFLESESIGRVVAPHIEEKEISKTDFGNGQTGYGIKFNTVFVVQGVLQRSMANRYGILSGDVILAINGKKTVGMELAELSAMIQSRPSVQLVLDQKDSMGPRQIVLHRDFPDEQLGLQLATVMIVTDLKVRFYHNLDFLKL